ncbi:interferon gamma receptor 2, partial [Tachysurus ichikawai]
FRRNLRVIMLGLLTVGALAFLGGCLYFVHKHYKRIKALFQPPLDIPAHYEEFFFSEFPERPATRPASQVAESYDIVALVEDVAEGEDRSDLEHSEEKASSM